MRTDASRASALRGRTTPLLLLAAGLAMTMPAGGTEPEPAAGKEPDRARYTLVDLGPLPARSMDDKPAFGEHARAALWRVVDGHVVQSVLVDAGRDAGGKTARDAGSNTARDTGSNSARDAGHSTARDAGLDASRAAGSHTAGDADRGAALGRLPGYPDTVATDMNAQGTIVGFAQGDDLRDTQAFAWAAGRLRPLPTLGGAHAVARAINQAGHIAGAATSAGGPLQATVWEDDQARGLGIPPGGDFSEAFAIADDDEVVGDATTAPGGKPRAFAWKGGAMRELGTLPGGSASSARAVNGRHEAVGYADRADNSVHAVLWSPGEPPRDLGNLGEQPAAALGINDAGQVVGSSAAAKGPMQAFLWEDGRMWNLNRLVAQGSGWQLTTAYSVNAQGEILGRGVVGGESHAFLLRPR